MTEQDDPTPVQKRRSKGKGAKRRSKKRAPARGSRVQVTLRLPRSLMAYARKYCEEHSLHLADVVEEGALDRISVEREQFDWKQISTEHRAYVRMFGIFLNTETKDPYWEATKNWIKTFSKKYPLAN
jgi:hypothetical protein